MLRSPYCPAIFSFYDCIDCTDRCETLATIKTKFYKKSKMPVKFNLAVPKFVKLHKMITCTCLPIFITIRP